MSAWHDSTDLDCIFMVCLLLNLYQVFVIWSVSLLPYNLDSLYRDHTLIMESTYVTWHWPIFTVSWFCYILLIRSVYPLLYNLSALYFIHTLIMESTSARHVWPDLEPFFHGLLVLTYIYVKYGWLGQFQRICLHFDDGAGSFMVHWFNFFLKKYFTQIICRRQTRHIFIYSCLIRLSLKNRLMQNYSTVVPLLSGYPYQRPQHLSSQISDILI